MDKKNAKKTRLEDIRMFWRKKDEEDMNSQENKTKKISLPEPETMTISKTKKP